MTEYQKWMTEQSDSFKQEILKDETKIREKFIDEKYRPISLQELKELDIKHNS
jgi:hypothetical protein